GSVDVTDSATGTVTLLASGANTTSGTFAFHATNASQLTNTGLVQAHTVTLVADSAANNGSLNLQASVTGTNAGTVNLTSYGSIENTSLNGNVSASTANLTSLNGDIGGAGSLTLNAANVKAPAPKGDVAIHDSATGTVNRLARPRQTPTRTLQSPRRSATQ